MTGSRSTFAQDPRGAGRRADAARRRLARAQIENLYVEAMVLADEAHGCFAGSRRLGAVGRGDARRQVALACESLKTTTRLMHVIAWLLHRRAQLDGEAGAHGDDSAARLGEGVAADWEECYHFDPAIQRLIAASEDLFARAAALDARMREDKVDVPVHRLIARIEAHL